jgi:hypothetical protein
MSGEFTRAEVDAINQRVQLAVDTIGEGIVEGTVTVTYEEPYWPTGQVWVKGECAECGATSVMRTSGNKPSLLWLATVISRYRCPENGHEVPR